MLAYPLFRVGLFQRAILQDIGDLGGGQPPVDGVERHAGLRRTDPGQMEIVGVLVDQGDAAVWRQAKGEQAAGNPVGITVKPGRVASSPGRVEQEDFRSQW